MKLRSTEATGLLILTGLCAIATVTAIFLGHEHLELMIVLTLVMALVAFVARYRHHKRVQTLHATGRRKRSA